MTVGEASVEAMGEAGKGTRCIKREARRQACVGSSFSVSSRPFTQLPGYPIGWFVSGGFKAAGGLRLLWFMLRDSPSHCVEADCTVIVLTQYISHASARILLSFPPPTPNPDIRTRTRA